MSYELLMELLKQLTILAAIAAVAWPIHWWLERRERQRETAALVTLSAQGRFNAKGER